MLALPLLVLTAFAAQGNLHRPVAAADSPAQYANYALKRVDSILLATEEEEIMQLARELVNQPATDVHLFAAKLDGLMDNILLLTDLGSRDQDLLASVIEGLSPNLKRDDGRSKIREYIDLFMSDSSLDTSLLWALVRQLTAPSPSSAQSHETKVILKLMERKLGVDTPLLRKIDEGTKLARKLFDAKATKRVQLKAWPKPENCQTPACQEIREEIYELGDSAILQPLLLNNAGNTTKEAYNLAKQLMRADEEFATAKLGDLILLVTPLAISNMDYGKLTMLTVALPKVVTEAGLFAFLGSLRNVVEMGETRLGWTMTGVFERMHDPRQTVTTHLRLKRYLRTSPDVPQKNKEKLAKIMGFLPAPNEPGKVVPPVLRCPAYVN